MFVHVDSQNGIALYEQIMRQIKFAVASEAIQPGNLVPSVRELAGELTVNPNTVARAYRELQSEDILQPIRGTGLEVTPGAVKRCREDRQSLLRERIRSVMAESRQSGLSWDEIREMFEAEIGRLEARKDRT